MLLDSRLYFIPEALQQTNALNGTILLMELQENTVRYSGMPYPLIHHLGDKEAQTRNCKYKSGWLCETMFSAMIISIRCESERCFNILRVSFTICIVIRLWIVHIG